MSRQLSIEGFRSAFAQQTDEVWLTCLTLEHSQFVAPLRVVQNNQAITRGGQKFLPAFFDIALPEEAPDKVPQVTLAIDNVDRGITDLIRTIQGRIKVTMEVVLASHPDTVEAGPFVFWLLSVTYDAQIVQGVLGFEDDVLGTEFPKHKYTPINSPGLWK